MPASRVLIFSGREPMSESCKSCKETPYSMKFSVKKYQHLNKDPVLMEVATYPVHY